MTVISTNLERAKKLFEFVINSPDEIPDVDLFREDLVECVAVLDAQELVNLGNHILPLILKDGGNVLNLLITSLKSRSV